MHTPYLEPSIVLVVEDDATLSDVVTTALADDGYRVLTAKNGHEAIAFMQRRPPDAIVLDLMLPQLDGWQVVRWCRTHAATSALPIIIVTGAPNALEDGNIQSLVFLEKPFDLNILLVLVEDAVSSSVATAVA